MDRSPLDKSDGGFGDFEEQDFGAFNEQDNDFDDFQEFNNEPFVAQTQTPATPIYPPIEIIIGDPNEEQRVLDIIKDIEMDPIIADKLKRAYPVFPVGQYLPNEQEINFTLPKIPKFDWNKSILREKLHEHLVLLKKDSEVIEIVREESVEDSRETQLENAKLFANMSKGIFINKMNCNRNPKTN